MLLCCERAEIYRSLKKLTIYREIISEYKSVSVCVHDDDENKIIKKNFFIKSLEKKSN